LLSGRVETSDVLTPPGRGLGGPRQAAGRDGPGRAEPGRARPTGKDVTCRLTAGIRELRARFFSETPLTEQVKKLIGSDVAHISATRTDLTTKKS